MTDYNFEPRHREMGRHIASGIVNSGVAQVVKVLGQFISVIVLSRLLSPSDFGLIAMVSPVSGFVATILDLGFTQATIQKPTLNHEEVNTLFWINIGMGIALAVILVAVSPLIGWYYREPRVVALTAAMGLLILASAAGNQHTAILTRRMEFGVLTLINVAGTVSALGISIAWALVFGGYWSLYAGMVAGTLIPVLCIWIASRWRPSAPRVAPDIHHLLKFGGHLTIASLGNFFAANMDNILIGRHWGDHDLGLYDRAYKLLLFPVQRIAGPVMGTMVPVLSRLIAEPERYRSAYLKVVAQLTLAIWPGIVWAIALAGTLVPTLLGRQWTGSSAIFQLLAIAGLLQVANSSTYALLISQGRSAEYARLCIVSAVTCIAAFVIGLPYGPIGVAGAYAVNECLRTPVLWWYVARRGPVKLRDVIHAILPQTACIVASALALLAYRHLLAAAPPILFLPGGLLLSYAAAALAMLLSPAGRRTLAQTLAAGQRLLLHMRLKNEN